MTGHHSNHSSSRRRFLTAVHYIADYALCFPSGPWGREETCHSRGTEIGYRQLFKTAALGRGRIRTAHRDAEAELTVLLERSPKPNCSRNDFRKHHPATSVHTCSSGTAAVHIAVAAAGTQPGDEIITAPITDIGTVTGILFQQAVPVFADLEPHTYNLNVEDVKKKITPKTRANHRCASRR